MSKIWKFNDDWRQLLIMKNPPPGVISATYNHVGCVCEWRQPELPSDDVIKEYQDRNKKSFEERIITGKRKKNAKIRDFECPCCKRSFRQDAFEYFDSYNSQTCSDCFVYMHHRKNGDDKRCLLFTREATLEEFEEAVKMLPLQNESLAVFNFMKKHYKRR